MAGDVKSTLSALKRQEREQRQELIKQKKFLIDSLTKNREAFVVLNKLRKRIQELDQEGKS